LKVRLIDSARSRSVKDNSAFTCFSKGLEKCKQDRKQRGYNDAEELYSTGERVNNMAKKVLKEMNDDEDLTSRFSKIRISNSEPSSPQTVKEKPSFYTPQPKKKTCTAIIKSGSRKGEQCGREKPCQYH
jgi:hypothetical protein